MRLRRTFSSPVFVALTTLTTSAALSAPSPQNTAVAPAAAGQKALAVSATNAGVVMAHVCAREADCQAEGGTSIEVPDEAKKLASLGQKVERKQLAGGRHVVRVALGKEGAGSWVALLAGPIAANDEAPLTLWSGFTGQAKGEEGEGRTFVVLEEPLDKGSRIVVGEHRDDVTICGRQALVAAREIDPTTMTLKRGVSVQSLSKNERERAVKLVATTMTEARSKPAVRLLSARSASSALGKAMATLTDGDPETTWSEAKTGAGRGELVMLASSSDVPIVSLEFVIRPPTTEMPEGAAPKRFYLATTDELFEITLPEDAWKKPGAHYEVKPAKPLTTSCLSVVLDEAYSPATADKAQVTIAEITAHTELDESNAEALVGALAGGGPRSKAAAALLERAGKDALPALKSGYGKLDEDGKRLANGVMDAAPCTEQAPFYVGVFGDRIAAIAGKEKGHKAAAAIAEDRAFKHAEDHLRRCGRAAAPALAELLTKHDGAVKVHAAAEIALVAPSEAVPVLADALATPNDAMRYEMRQSLAHAARNDRALAALGVELEAARFATRSEVVQIDLLRALGPRIGDVPGGREAFVLLAKPDASFRVRYLLQGPAAELARTGDAQAEAYLLASLRKDADPHVRTRAAEVSARAPKIQAALIEAASDPEVRVRSASVLSLGAMGRASGAPPLALVAVLAERLAKDPFTFVRTQAARALGEMPATPASDAALARALSDASPEVRARALDGLGEHHATAYLPQIRVIAEDDETFAEVRARAILALAAMCDTALVDAWTKLAQRVAYAVDDSERTVGAAAIAALGDVKPKDLAKRLAVLLDERAPRNYREMAKAALEAAPKCK